METTGGTAHKNTVHAWPGRKLKLAVTNVGDSYLFDGWYTNAAGTGTAASTDATYEPTAPSAGSEITYYAKFKDAINLTVKTVIDGSTSTTAAGAIKINGTDYTTASPTVKIAKGSSVTLSATANDSYTFDGFYTLATGGSKVNSPVTVNSDTTYYARFNKKAENNTVIYITPRSYWGDNYYIRLYDSGGSNVTGGVSNTGFVKAEYDKATGYYKATISSVKSGTFNAILAKDTNYTDKVPSTGGRSGTLGKSYIFDSGSSGALKEYNNERCYWFIDGTSWIKNNVNSGTSTMIVWDAKNSKDINMTRVNDLSYIIESTATNGDKLYFKEQGNNWKNEWEGNIKANYNQYTATNSGGSGSWTN